MSSCYIVVASNEKDGITTCEAYAGVQSALGRAVRLATQATNNITLIDTSPEEEKLEDGSIRWVFLDTNVSHVAVYFKRIETSMPAHNSRLDAVQSVPTVPAFTFIDGYQAAPPVSLPPDDPYADELPGGWNVDDEPIRMRHYKDSAEDIKNPCTQLTDDERWALATARISKRPSFTVTVGVYTYSRYDALQHIKARNPIGMTIRDKEMQLLGVYREKIIDSYYR